MALYVRKTYFDIDCDNRTIGSQKIELQRKIDRAGLSWPNNRAALGSAWQEYKVGTVSSRRVLLLLELSTDTGAFYDFGALKSLVLRQKSNRFKLNPNGQAYTYRLFNYVPFKAQEHRQYQQEESQTERSIILAYYLKRHLELLAERLQLNTDTPLLEREVKFIRQKKIRLGGQHHLAFDLEFKSPLFIPEFLGVGLGTMVGCGVVRKNK